MSKAAIEIRACKTHEEFSACVELQRTLWGFDDFDLVPKDIFIIAAKTGGQLYGAFDGATQVGFAVSFPAIREGKPYLHSHMLAVLPDYQNRGVGQKLKLQQRDEALARGLDLIEWTFDPLALKNAHFNIMRLGIVVKRYVRDQYGQTSSPLHAGLPTDRLVAEWWLGSPRVKDFLSGKPAPVSSNLQRIAIPRDIHELREKDLERAKAVHTQTREDFERFFGQGYTVTGFEQDEENGIYLLEQL